MGGEKANEDHGWGLDPLWDSYVRLTVGTLKGLKAINPESPNILSLPMGRAVEKVRVLGDIVSVKWKATSTMIEFHVDDGTGLLACIWWLNPGWGDKPYVKGGLLCPSLVTHCFSLSRTASHKGKHTMLGKTPHASQRKTKQALRTMHMLHANSPAAIHGDDQMAPLTGISKIAPLLQARASSSAA
jgi:hypothetical protein